MWKKYAIEIEYKFDKNGGIGNNCWTFLAFKSINDNDRRLINSFKDINERKLNSANFK